MSDDGSTVAFAFMSNVSAGVEYDVYSAQLVVLDGQSGKLLYSRDLRNIDPYVTPSASISRHGEYVAFSNGLKVYIINRDGTNRGQPVDKQSLGFTHICPMGTFIVWGGLEAHIAKWNATANTYTDKFVISGRDSKGIEWFANSLATTINGGGSHPGISNAHPCSHTPISTYVHQSHVTRVHHSIKRPTMMLIWYAMSCHVNRWLFSSNWMVFT
jgi:hypothetical protein